MRLSISFALNSDCWCVPQHALRLRRRWYYWTKTVRRHCRHHIVNPCFVGADRFEFRSQLALAHAAGSDDLEILLVTVEVGADLKPDPIGIKKIERMDRWGNRLTPLRRLC